MTRVEAVDREHPTLLVCDSGFDDLGDRIVVSPGFGRFEARPPRDVTAEGEIVYRGDVLGEVHASSTALPVHAPCDAWLLRVLTLPGERVRPGRPLVHLRPL